MNAEEADKTKAPTLISMPVGLLMWELPESLVASTTKLCEEFEKRCDDNANACNVLHNHQHLWASVGGPQVESLFCPGVEDIGQAKMCCDTLQKMAEGNEPDTITDR